ANNLSRASNASRLLIATLPLILTVACSVNRRPNDGAPSLGRPLESGVASWYGPGFQGRRTASGEKYNMYDLTAAHPSLPFGTRLAVRNVRTGKMVVVRVNDRGPFKKSRILDLSFAAAKEVGVFGPGTAYVEIYPAPAGRRDEPPPAPVAVFASLTADEGPPPRYTVQVGAFSDASRAVELHREIARLYPEVFVHSDGTWNRVQVGLFTDREQAESLRRELAVMGMSSVVVATR
ncbi:MAG TPA: septal ring lytic transglycosylase RlpA family protein, partial [Thermoanaerobaculia bacterium]|nr:septal ring lytic transglycosylase RlpA family protein [Thermoanaerobaculia bacterium]